MGEDLVIPVSPVHPSPLLRTDGDATALVVLGPLLLGFCFILLLVTMKIGDDDDDDNAKT